MRYVPKVLLTSHFSMTRPAFFTHEEYDVTFASAVSRTNQPRLLARIGVQNEEDRDAVAERFRAVERTIKGIAFRKRTCFLPVDRCVEGEIVRRPD